MLQSIQRISNYIIYSFIEQINDKFFNVTFTIFDSQKVRVNILQYKDIYKRYFVKSINFDSISFNNVAVVFAGHEFDLKMAFDKAFEEFSSVYQI